GFGLQRTGAMQVQFVLGGKLAAAQALPVAAGHPLAAERTDVATQQHLVRRIGQAPVRALLLGVAAQRNAWTRRRRRRHRRPAQRRDLADRGAEQLGVVLVVLVHAHSLAQPCGAEPWRTLPVSLGCFRGSPCAYWLATTTVWTPPASTSWPRACARPVTRSMWWRRTATVPVPATRSPWTCRSGSSAWTTTPV